MENVQFKAQTSIFGSSFKVDTELNLHTPKGIFTKEQMQAFADEAKGLNRLHKPMALLFWIDVKNGKVSNWRKV